MLRRRLSFLAKVVLRVAYDCAHGVSDARVVFASRHGELVRTTSMLEDLAIGEGLSPAVFGMSVLNASVGLFSILEQNSAPATAISAGCASFGFGLMEACLQLAENPAQPVLFVYADEPVPAVYEEADEPPAHAIGILLDSSSPMRVACTTAPGQAVHDDEAQSQAFLRCLVNGRSEWHEAGRSWRWEKMQ
jgi:hypothetical protein